MFPDQTSDTPQQPDSPQHATAPAATDPQPTPHLETADQSFWSAVYTLEPPHTLMGVLTDLHIHRYLLHQHLATHTALADTPIGHEPLTDTLPPAIQRIISIYHNNLQRAQYHTRTALNTLDVLARFPPSAYFTDSQLFPEQHPSQSPPDPSAIPRRYPLPTTTGSGNTFQHASTQTNPNWVSVLDNPIQAPNLDQSQQTTPRPTTQPRHVQTDIHGIVMLPAFAAAPTSSSADQAPSGAASTVFDTATPTPTAAANKQPHEHWQYVNLIPTPIVTPSPAPDHSFDFTSAIGGTPRNRRRSQTPPRTTTPPRVRFPDPRTGSPIPKPRASPHSVPPPQPAPTVQPLPKRPPPTLYQCRPTPPAPSTAPWPTFQGEPFTPHPATTAPTVQQPPHAWPAHYPVPQQPTHYYHPTQQPAPQYMPPPQAAAVTTPPPQQPLRRDYYAEQGRSLSLSHENYDPANDPWMAE